MYAWGRYISPEASRKLSKLNIASTSNRPRGGGGEFLPQDHRRFVDGDGYIIELEDGRRGECYIKKIVNRVIPTVPPIYNYYFRGGGRLEKPTD